MPATFVIFICITSTSVKRTLAAIIGLTLLLGTPTTAAAAQVAISTHYVQRTLDRADEGIAYAWTGPSSFDFLIYILSWIQSVGSTFFSFIDTDLRIVEQKRDILERTACFRIDLFLLELKLERVRKELKRAFESQNIIAIHRLQDLALFLNERYAVLLNGGRDPEARDKRWIVRRLFDPPRLGWCCNESLPGSVCQEKSLTTCTDAGGAYYDTLNECTQFSCFTPPPAAPAIEQQVLCPFHSNYLPPNLAGYGCDVEATNAALGNLTAAENAIRPSAETERDALQKVQGQMNDYVNQVRALLSLQREIDELLGRESEITGELPARAHKTINSCVDTEEEKRELSKLTTWELRGPFSFEKDENRLLNAFRELRRKQGNNRPPPTYYDITLTPNTVFKWLIAKARSLILRKFSIQQGESESTIFAEGSDPHLSTREAIRPLIKSVGRLSRLASTIEKEGEAGGEEKEKGLRGFVRDFAFFLRRTCLYRPCNARLERVLKIIFEDECFPFTDGRYLDQGYDYTTCGEAAKVGVSL